MKKSIMELMQSIEAQTEELKALINEDKEKQFLHDLIDSADEIVAVVMK